MVDELVRAPNGCHLRQLTIFSHGLLVHGLANISSLTSGINLMSLVGNGNWRIRISNAYFIANWHWALLNYTRKAKNMKWYSLYSYNTANRQCHPESG